MTVRPDDAPTTASPDESATSEIAPPADGAVTVTVATPPERSRLQRMGGLGYKPQHVRLKCLVLDNFKSFATRTRIDLLEGFTAISGPNGSGKSNLIDAMLFVLGFASSKGLRADRLTDLINSESGKPVARVSLELEVTTDTGEQKSMEVSRVVRRIRQGESQAHYELDGAPVRMADLHDILHDLGLPSSGLNVVVQNDVTKITALGEVARRQILDELAGAQEFDKRIKAANVELSQADQAEGEIKIILAEIESNLVKLEKEKEQALAYRALSVEKDRLEAELFVLDVLEAQEKARKKQEQALDHKDRVHELEEDLVDADKRSAEAKAALDAVEAEIAAKGEGERLRALKEVEALKANAGNKRAKAGEARAEAESVQAKGADRQATLEGATAREAALAQREEGLRKDLEKKSEQHAELRREVDLAAAELQKRAKGTINAVEVQRVLHKDADKLRKRESEITTTLRSLGETVARHGAERGLLLQTLEVDRARKAEVDRLAAEAGSAKRLAAEDKAREEERLRKLLQRQAGLRAGIEKADHDLATGMADLGRLDERRKATLEQAGGRGLEAIRREGLAGIHGPVHQLIKFSPEHAMAIEAAAGARLSWVVVDDEHVGKRAIEVLKRSNAGRLTFTPLTRIQPPRVELRPVRGHGVVGYALDLVEFDGTYDAVLRTVLGDTLIVETMQAAIELGINRYRMVTLDGDLLDKNGTMTGGANTRGGTALAMAARLEQEIATKQAALEEVRRRRDAARLEVDAVEAEGKTAQAAFASRQQKHSQASAEFEQHHQELVRLESKIAPAEKRLELLDAELGRAQTEIQALEAELAQLRASLQTIEAQLLQQPSASGQDAYEELERRHLASEETMRDLERALGDAREVLARVQVDRRGAEAEVEAARRAIAEAQAAIESALARATEADAEATRLEAELSVKEKQVAHLMDELRELTERRDEAASIAQDARDGAKEVARLLDAEKKAKDAAETELAELSKIAAALTAQAEERKLVLPPVVAADPDEVTASGKRKRRRKGAEAAAEAPPSESGENAAPDAIKANELPKLRDTARRELAKTEGKMKALEPVNMKAIEQHAENAARKAELDERLATLDREVTAIRVRIVELEGAKKTAFLQAFEQVEKAFRENFTELTGGEGWIELTNPESPFEGGLTITARPRNQKAARLESLSGGEKTLTALAFLFALQKVNPAPFFVFDEVDASLDGANTGRLADAIRRRGHERQYFVVSHRRALVEKAHQAIGVTKRKGVGTMVAGITLEEVAAVEASIEAEKKAAALAAKKAGAAAPAGKPEGN